MFCALEIPPASNAYIVYGGTVTASGSVMCESGIGTTNIVSWEQAVNCAVCGACQEYSMW